jgi:hypothetical protein
MQIYSKASDFVASQTDPHIAKQLKSKLVETLVSNPRLPWKFTILNGAKKKRWLLQISEAQPLIIEKDSLAISYLRWALDNISPAMDNLSHISEPNSIELEAKVQNEKYSGLS